MKKWKQKAIVQKTISYLPFKHGINFLFQKYVTKGVQLSDEYFTDRLTHASDHIAAFEEFASAPLGSALELGTGWYPVVPVCLFLYGAKKAVTVDISGLLNRKNLSVTLNKFIEYRKTGKLSLHFKNGLGDEVKWRMVEELAANRDLTLEQLLTKLNIQYKVADARHLDEPAHSFSLITSNNTFEHVYETILREILVEFRRLAAKGGVMSHFVDMSDHFAHFDKSITIYNFLQFSKEKWDRIDNSIQPQNRLRITDYRKIYSELGIGISKEVCRPGSEKELAAIKVDKMFSNISLKELAVSHCLLVSKM
jgi:ubiquinone/menaquinone biosynthesis C-methylase UbiE